MQFQGPTFEGSQEPPPLMPLPMIQLPTLEKPCSRSCSLMLQQSLFIHCPNGCISWACHSRGKHVVVRFQVKKAYNIEVAQILESIIAISAARKYQTEGAMGSGL